MNRRFQRSLNFVLNQLFAHQEEANSSNFYPKKSLLKAITMDLKRRIKELRKALLLYSKGVFFWYLLFMADSS